MRTAGHAHGFISNYPCSSPGNLLPLTRTCRHHASSHHLLLPRRHPRMGLLPRRAQRRHPANPHPVQRPQNVDALRRARRRLLRTGAHSGNRMSCRRHHHLRHRGGGTPPRRHRSLLPAQAAPRRHRRPPRRLQRHRSPAKHRADQPLRRLPPAPAPPQHTPPARAAPLLRRWETEVNERLLPASTAPPPRRPRRPPTEATPQTAAA